MSGDGGGAPAGIRPHGGRLVDRHSGADPSGLERVEIPDDLANDMENIADGIFSPLEGPLARDDFESVVSSGRLADGTAWTVPVMLDVDRETAGRVKAAGDVLLARAGGAGEAVLHAEEAYGFDKKKAAEGVYGTSDAAHPGVARMLSANDVLVGGRIDYLRRPADAPARRLRMTPAQTRAAFSGAGWRTVVAFQTRNPPHVAHEMLQKASITDRDGVFVNPLVGRKKPGDFVDDVIVRCYEAVIRHYYPPDRCRLATLHTEMRYAGPREAIHHAIMRQNFGCTHIIIGRDHAGVGSYYDPFAAHRAFDDYPDLEITPVFFPAFFYCSRCLAYTNPRACPHAEGDREQISGTGLRRMVREGRPPSKFILRPEVSRIILDHPAPFVE